MSRNRPFILAKGALSHCGGQGGWGNEGGGEIISVWDGTGTSTQYTEEMRHFLGHNMKWVFMKDFIGLSSSKDERQGPHHYSELAVADLAIFVLVHDAHHLVYLLLLQLQTASLAKIG